MHPNTEAEYINSDLEFGYGGQLLTARLWFIDIEWRMNSPELHYND
jgi:hypothetical protein